MHDKLLDSPALPADPVPGRDQAMIHKKLTKTAVRPSPPGTSRSRRSPRAGARAKTAAQALADLKSGREDALPVKEVREGFGLSREKFSRLTGFSVRALAAWENGEMKPAAQARRRFAELSRLLDALGGVVQRKAIPSWMDAPNPSFGGLKPIEIIERGEVDRLWRVVYELESGAGF